MPKQPRKLDYIPEILYETPAYPGEKVSPIPFMEIPKDKDMPVGLFVLEYRHTGEFEQGTGKTPEEIMDGPYPHMFVEFNYLTEVLKEQFPELDIDATTDKIRIGMGMKPLKQAKEEGEKILDKVQAKEEFLEKKAKLEQESRIEKIKSTVKDKKDLN